MSTAFDLDLDLLVGEMEAPLCESPHHCDGESHDDGPATHYMRIGHACYGPVSQVIPVCATYNGHWSQLGKTVYCHWCRTNLEPEQHNKSLGPIGGGH